MQLTEAQRALCRILAAGCCTRSITLFEIRRYGLALDFQKARRARLIVSAGYETSAAADDWLNSPAGRLALAAADRAKGEGG